MSNQVDLIGVVQVFQQVQELNDKPDKTFWEKQRLKNLEKLQNLTLEAIDLGIKFLPKLEKQLENVF